MENQACGDRFLAKQNSRVTLGKREGYISPLGTRKKGRGSRMIPTDAD